MDQRPMFLLLLLLLASALAVFCDTNAQDAAALQSLTHQWTNYPSSWTSGDPCDSWANVTCSGGRVTSLKLSGVNLQGILSSSIGQLSQLVILLGTSDSICQGNSCRNIFASDSAFFRL